MKAPNPDRKRAKHKPALKSGHSRVKSIHPAERELAIKNAISDVLLLVPDDRMYPEILKIMQKAFNSPLGFFGYIDESGDMVVPSLVGQTWTMCRIPDKTQVFPRANWRPQATWCRALARRKPILANKPSLHTPRGHVRLKRHMITPIVYRSRAIGIIAVANKASAYSQAELQLLHSLGNKIAPLLSARMERDRLEREHATAQEKTAHLNSVLRAVRNVNQLINQERRQNRLLQAVCEELVNTRGYNCAHLALLDDAGNFAHFAHAGENRGADRFRELLLKGERPACARQLLLKGKDYFQGEAPGFCRGCSLQEHLKDKNVMAARLFHGERTYGMLVTCLPKHIQIQQEETELLIELAADVSFGLYGLELEDQRQNMEHELLQRNWELQERLKERTMLYGALRLATDPSRPIESTIKSIASAIPSAMQFPQIAGARISLEDSSFQSKRFQETDQRLSWPIKLKGKEIGRIDVCYIQAVPKVDGDAFLKEEWQLIESVAAQISELISRRRAELALRETEANFQQAQKMEAIGLLAGGAAHDFNNLAAVILGYSDLLLRDLPPDDPGRGRVEKIRQSAERAGQLTQQLLAFGRRQTTVPQVMNLNDLIGEIQSLLDRLLGEDISIDLVLRPDLGNARLDPAQMQQVLFNLLTNARDAMPRGGCITIETGNAVLDAAFAERHPGAKPGPHVMLAVRDTGHGMDENIRAHVFEPFFTTKPRGEGSGMGLSTVYGIVKQSNGYVTCTSTPGQGSTFIIYFPRVEENSQPIPHRSGASKLQTGSETILVVEDEDLVRDMAVEMLRPAGYKILTAGSAREAINIARRRTEPIHLLLTDVIMPEMDGVQLVKRFSELSPETKVLYMSGYLEETIVKREILTAGVPLLQKPFSEREMLRAIRETLNQ